MMGLEAEAHWSEQTKAICRLYQSLQSTVQDLPPDERVELSRRMATDLVLTIAAANNAGTSVDTALTSISAICQSRLFERTAHAPMY